VGEVGEKEAMKATIQRLRSGYCEAKTTTDILVVFTPPTSLKLQLGDVLDVDLLKLDSPQSIQIDSSGCSFEVVIKSINVHDLRMYGGHGTSRTPSIERRMEQPLMDSTH